MKPADTPPQLSCAVTLRNPMRYERLPLISRLQRAAFRRRRRFAKRFIGKPARKLYHAARKLGLNGHGVFSFEAGTTKHRYTFDARNSQFTSAEDRAYEPELAALLDLLLDDDGVFFDIGANWGYFPLYVLGRANFAGTVHAFEGYPPTYADLASIAGQSPFGERLICHAVALSDRSGQANMGLIDGVNSGLARLDGSQAGFQIATRRLDDMNLPAPSLIKIDVEGHEAQVFRGAQRVLKEARPVVIFENWREPLRPAITLEPFAVLEDLHYRFYAPTWVQEIGGASFGITATNAEPTDRFGLVEIDASHRFMLDSQINILAYPAERLSELHAHFQAKQKT